MSDYSEPRNRRISPLYVLTTILGTVLALATVKFVLGIDIIGGLVEFLTSLSDGLDTRIDFWNDTTSAFLDKVDQP